MLKRTIAPGIYLRESGIRHLAGQYCTNYGKKAYLIGGKMALSVIERDLINSLDAHGVEALRVKWYGGEVSWNNIQHLAEEAKSLDADLIIGIGGGKALDTAKSVAYRTQLPIVIIPTIAATCAAWTAISVIYTDDGVFLEVTQKAKNPNLVLVDTEIIAQAPLDLLIAGIGDTLAKWYELEITFRNKVHNPAIAAAHSIGNLCNQTLIKHGSQAIKAAEKNKISEDLEQIIDANIFLSGMVSSLGGEDFGACAAHAIYNGFTVLKDVHAYYHGSIVAYGILCQLILDKKEEEVLNLIPFYKATQLPYTLSQLGVKNFSEEKGQSVAKLSIQTDDMDNMPFKVTEEMVIEAIRRVDQLGKEAGENNAE